MADGLQVSEIFYTGRAPTTANGDEPEPFAHVKFTYEARHEARSARFGSVTLPRKKRLKNIVTNAGIYTMTYDEYHPGQSYTATNDPMLPTRLKSIGYCASDNVTCMKPLDFEW